MNGLAGRTLLHPPCPELSELGKISIMTGPIRVTSPLLDVLEVLLQAFDNGAEIHGWAIMKATKRSGPTVYGVIDRLEDASWIAGRWESENPEPNRPRRRLYQLTPTGIVKARELVSTRRARTTHAPHVQPWPAPGPAVLSWARVLLAGGAR